MLKQSIEPPSRLPETPLSMEEIASVFALLGLESEQQREIFRAMSQTSQAVEDKTVQFWLTGTTDSQETNEGGPHA